MSRRARLAVLLAITLVATGARAEPARRMLHVSLYPFIPDAAAAALALKQGFERTHPDVIADIALNRDYYDDDPAKPNVLRETADLHEIDVVFLRDFVAGHRLAPLPPDLAATAGYEPLARAAAGGAGGLVAVPHWMCADFLIYRADRIRLADIDTLDGLDHALGGAGLLIDMKGTGTLGELYLGAVLARDGGDGVIARLAPRPDPAILDRLRRLLALDPPGFGRSAADDARVGFHARQFARGAGAAFVGYSEMIHEALAETANSCRAEDRCVTADEIGVAPVPFADHVARPAVWVDMFAIDARANADARADAAEFIRYAVSLPAYRDLLVPESGEPPRYLLPATSAAFDDPAIQAAAPLYARLRAIAASGEVVTAPGLAGRLHEAARAIDAALPTEH